MADYSGANGMNKDIADGIIIRVKYKCGEQTCGAITEIKTGDAIICRTCGHRLLYKIRTSRLVQFEAR